LPSTACPWLPRLPSHFSRKQTGNPLPRRAPSLLPSTTLRAAHMLTCLSPSMCTNRSCFRSSTATSCLYLPHPPVVTLRPTVHCPNALTHALLHSPPLHGRLLLCATDRVRPESHCVPLTFGTPLRKGCFPTNLAIPRCSFTCFSRNARRALPSRLGMLEVCLAPAICTVPPRAGFLFSILLHTSLDFSCVSTPLTHI
jgi:hypothetical protein